MYEELANQPYSLYFFMAFQKELIRNLDSVVDINECMEILRTSQKNILDSDIEIFLYYCPEVSLSIVKDMLEESSNNPIDRESRQLAIRIKKCPHYKVTKQIFDKQ